MSRKINSGGLPPMPDKVVLKKRKKIQIDWKRLFFILLGVALFCGVYFSPDWDAAIDPRGQSFELSHEGKAAIALFLLAAVWWVFEVVPIGVTGMAIGVIQVLFLIRDAEVAFKDFMDPSVWFIFASLSIGIAFTKTGLTQRMAYKMLYIVGERTSMIYLGCYIMIAGLAMCMAHTAVAAAVYPLLMTINSLYDDSGQPTKFGKGLFIGMAFVAGAGSIITLLGAARGAIALGFYQGVTGVDVSFFKLSYYMFPIGWLMVFLLWGSFMLIYKPEKPTIPGLKEKAKRLNDNLGPLTKNEIITLILVFSAIGLLVVRSFVPELKFLNKSAIMLVPTIFFFVLKILSVRDLENIPWNIILLFGGAMCIGFCLWQTGAANWLAVNWLSLFKEANWLVFVMGIAFLVMLMTNFIMNVAAIAIVLPIALVTGQYLGVSSEVILFSSLVTAGMPFLLLIGAAPNAIAYESKQFTTGEFFLVGIPMSILLMLVLFVFIWIIWPAMGMSVVATL
jgi:sodium-dependent dicarboxylate transporter 2/3/5